MRMIDLSIICVYNNEDCLHKHLSTSLKRQNVECETIFLDNRSNKYHSAASALNAGIKQSTKRFVLIVHQDIHFTAIDVVEKIYTYLMENSQDIIGSAGVKIASYGVYSSMVHGTGKEKAGAFYIETKEPVDVLDECLIAGDKMIFEENPFDEKTCDGWDLYVVDFCLQIKFLYRVYVLPLDIWHVSPGNPTRDFYRCARKIFIKYRKRISHIRTCCITVQVSTKWYSSIILTLLEIRYLLRKQK